MLGTKALAHGTVSSFMTRARGGKWNAGFLAGFAGTMLSPITGMAKGYYAKVASSAIVAGTVSYVSGGKFANGAMSGAFRFMFNDLIVNVDRNIKRTELLSGQSKFLAVQNWITKVQGGGIWDYKRIYGLTLGEDLGNFNYGATGAVLGFSQETLLKAAGFVQILSGTARFEYIDSNFDDPQDQLMIKYGYEYYKFSKGQE
jgi:hypothetical protein